MLACKSCLKRLNPNKYGSEKYDEELRSLRLENVRLKKKLDAAKQCVFAVADALRRGNGNDWAEEAIEEYEQKWGV